jgi:hypothetical protein
MKDLLIQLAGGMAILTAVFHQASGEIRLFPAIDPAVVPSKSLLRGVWLNGSMAWIGIGILLFRSPSFASQPARNWIATIAIMVLGSAAIGAWHLKKRHPGWVFLAVAAGLALAGM